jgi:hypothetical protein
MENQTTDTTASLATPAIEPQQTRLAAALAAVKGAPKWVLMAVPAAVVALGGYSYLHGDQSGAMIGTAPQAAQVAPAGQAPGFIPVADYAGPAYGNAYGHNAQGDAYGNGYGNGYGRGYGHGHGNGRARGNFSFSMGGDMSGDGNGYGNGYGNGAGNGYGHNRYNNGYYY